MKRLVALAALLMMAGWTQAQAPASTVRTTQTGQPMVAPAVAGKPLPHHKKVVSKKKAAKKSKAAAHKSRGGKLKKHPKKTGKKAVLAHHHAANAKVGKVGKAGKPATQAAAR